MQRGKGDDNGETAGKHPDSSFGVPEFDLGSARVSYGLNEPLREEWLSGGWLPLFTTWVYDAQKAGIREHNAMVLATTDGIEVASRTVLCKEMSRAGLTFYTTRSSRKGKHLSVVPAASATFAWLPLERQVHVSGRTVALSDEESVQYWEQRPRGSQIAAWASSQSQPIDSAESLKASLNQATARFRDLQHVPKPEMWGGYRIEPNRVEFWQGGADRFHDRLVCTRQYPSDPNSTPIDVSRHEGWSVQRLQP